MTRRTINLALRNLQPGGSDCVPLLRKLGSCMLQHMLHLRLIRFHLGFKAVV